MKNLEHGQVLQRFRNCFDYPYWVYASTQMAELIIYYWPNIDLQAAIQLIVRELCTLTQAEQF